jgi:hypothetical protein
MHYLVGKFVEFAAQIEDMEAYPEPGMRAQIVSVNADTSFSDPKEHIYTIVFDYTEFDDYNKNFESANYYDPRGVACLTARQADLYRLRETIYFGCPDHWPFENYFTVLNAHQLVLIERFKKSGQKNYLSWLEDQILIEEIS